ncbi:MAG: hypothetical protein ACFCBV_08265 [Phycisphaerales bacterium]
MRRTRGPKPPRRPRVCTPRLVLVSILVGVVLAVATVPAGAIQAQRSLMSVRPIPHRQPFTERSSGDTYVRLRWPGATWWFARTPEWWNANMHAVTPRFVRVPLVESEALPARVRAVVARGNDEVFDVSAGWPWRAAYFVRHQSVWDHTATHPGQLTFRASGREWFVPCLPLWLGLLGNTLVFTLPLAVLWSLSRWHRLRRRARRGLCLACAYELGEGIGACPECGLARAASR